MPLVPMSSMPNVDEQMRAANMMGSYGTLSTLCWNGEPSLNGLGFYGDQTPHQIGGFFSSLIGGSSKTKKKSDSADKKPDTAAQKQTAEKPASSGGSMTTYLIYGAAAIAGVVLIYSLTKKKKADEPKAPEEKPKIIYRTRTKPFPVFQAAQGAGVQ